MTAANAFVNVSGMLTAVGKIHPYFLTFPTRQARSQMFPTC
jgi:hypothetical protein